MTLYYWYVTLGNEHVNVICKLPCINGMLLWQMNTLTLYVNYLVLLVCYSGK